MTVLGGVAVQVGNVNAPSLYVGPYQINFGIYRLCFLTGLGVSGSQAQNGAGSTFADNTFNATTFAEQIIGSTPALLERSSTKTKA